MREHGEALPCFDGAAALGLAALACALPSAGELADVGAALGGGQSAQPSQDSTTISCFADHTPLRAAITVRFLDPPITV